MYLYLGQETVVRGSDVVGIFDLENVLAGGPAQEFLSRAEKEGRVVNVSWELPKSFVVCAENRRENMVYITQVAASTLRRRAGWPAGIKQASGLPDML